MMPQPHLQPPPVPHWLPRVVQDLRSESAELLQPGLAPAAPADLLQQQGPLLRAVLQACDAFTALLPGLLSDLAQDEHGAPGEWVRSPVPQGARMPRTPQDYIAAGDRVLPVRWLRFETALPPDSPALRWLLHLNAELARELQAQALRLQRHIGEALRARAGRTLHASVDAQTLKRLAGEVELRQLRLRDAAAQVRRLGWAGLRAHARAPSPYPRGRGWQRLRLIAQGLLDPRHALGALLGGLLCAPVAMADVPFLYQRWCGLQILLSLQRQGWHPRGERIGPLFLGGRVELASGSARITLWIDPRISSATMALTGWRCQHSQQELTPDFLITCGDIGQRAGYVLDATLSREDDVFRRKAHYLNDLTGVDAHWVAGVPVARRLLRSWAIAPLNRPACHLLDDDGRCGAVPLHPSHLNLAPLDAWLGDIARHARALAYAQTGRRTGRSPS
jgi:hypothetical protein